jgi:hypothetical protein
VASLDIAVSSAIMRLHALERALHDDGPWEMEFMGVRVPANRFVFNDRVQFCAVFPPMAPYLFFGTVELLCGGEAVALQPMPGWVCDQTNILDWVMELDPRVFDAVSV